MPATLTYPGVYIEEIPSGVRTITGVATSITAFLGRALKGPVNQAVTLNNYGDFETTYGGLDPAYPLGYAVRDFFQNGGNQAIIVAYSIRFCRPIPTGARRRTQRNKSPRPPIPQPGRAAPRSDRSSRQRKRTPAPSRLTRVVRAPILSWWRLTRPQLSPGRPLRV